MPIIRASTTLAYVAGDDILLEFTVTDQDGAVAIITGDTVRFAIARKPGHTPILTSESSPTTVTPTITNGAGGVFQVAIDKTGTSGLLGTYHWDAELEDATGDVSTVSRGWIVFEPEVV